MSACDEHLPEDSKQLLEAILNIQSLDTLMMTLGQLPPKILITIRDMTQYALDIKDLI